MSFRIDPDKPKLKKFATDVGKLILLRIARDVVRIARASTIKAEGPSEPGTPPHEHFGDLDRSIAIATRGDEVLAGPRFSVVGLRGSVLEFAGTYDPDAGRDKFGQFLEGHASRTAPSGSRWARPFMRPAFEQAISSGSFEGGNQTSSSFT
jgi:hypothetical protein